MVFTVEPMINVGCAAIRVLDDGWTVVTADGTEIAITIPPLPCTENHWM